MDGTYTVGCQAARDGVQMYCAAEHPPPVERALIKNL